MLELYLLFGIPIAVTAVFIVSLAVFLFAWIKNRKAPGSFSEQQIKSRGMFLIVMSCIFTVLFLVVVGFIITLMFSIAYM